MHKNATKAQMRARARAGNGIRKKRSFFKLTFTRPLVRPKKLFTSRIRWDNFSFFFYGGDPQKQPRGRPRIPPEKSSKRHRGVSKIGIGKNDLF